MSTMVGTSGYDGAVGLADVETGSLWLCGYHDHLVNAVSADPTGRVLVSSSSDYTLRVWDIAARRCQKVLEGHTDDVEGFAFIDERSGVSVSRDHTLRLWDLESGCQLRVFTGHERDALSVAYMDGTIWSSGDDMTLRQWDPRTGRQLAVLGPFDVETDTCAVDPVNRQVVLGADDGVIRTFDATTKRQRHEIKGHTSGIKRVCASPRTGRILSAGYDQRILLWSGSDMKLIGELYRPSGVWERSITFTGDGRHALAGTFEGNVVRWHLESIPAHPETIGRGVGNPCFNDVATCGGSFAAVSDDGLIRFGRIGRQRPHVRFTSPVESPRCLMNAVALSAGRLAVGTHDHRVITYSLRPDGLRIQSSIDLGEGPVNTLAFVESGPDEGDLVIGAYSGAIIALRSDGVRRKLSGHDGAVKSLRVLPDGTRGVSCAADGSVAMWGIGSSEFRLLGHHDDIANDLDIDVRGRSAVSVSRDFSVRRWDLVGCRATSETTLPHRSPKCVAVLPDDSIVVGDYWGGLLHLSSGAHPLQRAVIAGNGISALAQTSVGILAVSYDGGIYLWDVRSRRVRGVCRFMEQRVAISVANGSTC